MHRPSFGIVRLMCFLGGAAALAVFSQGAGPCPPLIQSLMPKIGEKVEGYYQFMEIVGKGFGVAQVPYKQTCPCPYGDPYQGKVSVELLHYGGDGVQLFQMQIDSVEQQTLQNAVAEFTRRQPKPTAHNALHPTRTEAVPGGVVVLYDYKSQCLTDCMGEGYPEGDWAVPHVNLLGVSHTDSSSVVVEVEGAIPPELAKAMAEEVFGNLKKANFSAKAGK